ncbi:protein FAM124A isoform X2 [Danio aesculapii]|uniref:protein FAM124A isoform X2 n=1 Tax=Danio aesculapii TaxID=1142201 RepID=UPI0024C0C179|nr:protein FAM124A isoform X2 [Danio aesculapii]XP_056321600.1 protein FAM124A isoform X2 [Danio aesculapii]XP_056321602.1 protein FAM124A isoform X2 [Danio aesculapii]
MLEMTRGRFLSGDLSMGDQQDPFLVSIHIITDPGQAKTLQQAADQVLSWLHPDLTLFRVSERAGGFSRKHKIRLQHVNELPTLQPALAIILFLQDEYGGEESLERLHSQLRHPPWRYHHTERVNGRGLLPLSAASQDFVTLAQGTPLWALRQVHYGKEIARFTVYCHYETYTEQVRLYRLLLRRKLAQKKEDFCFCVVYSNPETEIQLSFKRMPRGQSPAPTENAVMEIRVRDVGELVPLLPRPCTPISDVRWQTSDYDGNKILLQVQGSRCYRKHTIAKFYHLPSDDPSMTCPPPPEPPPPPPPYGRGPASYRNRRYHRNSSRLRSQTLPSPGSHSSRMSPQALCEQDVHMERLQKDVELLRAGWASHRTQSLFSLHTDESRSSCASPSGFRPRCFSSMAAPLFRVNVDTLVGAEETDVDTGQTISGSSVDLSVVSGYTHPQLRPHLKAPAPRLKSAPPTDGGPDFADLMYNNSCSMRQTPAPHRTQSISTTFTPCVLNKPKPKNVCVSQQDRGQHKTNGFTSMDECSHEGSVEDEQEFYI